MSEKEVTLEDLAQMLPIPDGIILGMQFYARSDDERSIEDADRVIIDSELFVGILKRESLEQFAKTALEQAQDIYHIQFRQMTADEIKIAQQLDFDEVDEVDEDDED